jgi:hypothetical protein
MTNIRDLLRYWVTSGALFTGALCGTFLGIIMDTALDMGSPAYSAIGAGLGALIALAIATVRALPNRRRIAVTSSDQFRMCLLIGTVLGIVAFGVGISLNAWPFGWFGFSVTVLPSLAFGVCAWLLASMWPRTHAR